MASAQQRWAAWQLLDSALPTGGFAHSQGLEAAAQTGWVGDGREGVELFCLTSLQSQASLSVPYVLKCQQVTSLLAPGSQPQPRGHPQMTEVVLGISSKLHNQLQGNHVARRASAALGVSLLRAVKAAFGDDEALCGLLTGLQHRRGDSGCHQACVFGAVAGALGFPPEETAHMFLFLVLRDTLSAATRLNLVGPMEAARIQRAVGEAAHQMAKGAVLEMSGDHQDCLAQAASSAPILELLQCNHDTLYSRLFSS